MIYFFIHLELLFFSKIILIIGGANKAYKQNEITPNIIIGLILLLLFN